MYDGELIFLLMEFTYFFLKCLPHQIVPPNQAKKMYEAVKGKGHPVVYKEFEGNRKIILRFFKDCHNTRHEPTN